MSKTPLHPLRRPRGARRSYWWLPAALAGLFALAAAVELALDMPAAWPLLSLCAVLSGGVVVWGLASGRALEPLPVVAAVSFLGFVVRPFQLFLSWPDLYSHYFPRRGAVGLVLLENQEVAFFVTNRLGERLEPALTRAMGVCALFLLLFCVGYALPFGTRLRRRVARLGARAPGDQPADGGGRGPRDRVCRTGGDRRPGRWAGCVSAPGGRPDRVVRQPRALRTVRFWLRRHRRVGGVALASLSSRVDWIRVCGARQLRVRAHRRISGPACSSR